MKRILKKTIFFSIIALLTFTLVASRGASQQILGKNKYHSDNCVVINSLANNQESHQVCTNIDPVQKEVSAVNLNLTDKERFLSVVANNLTTVPQTGSYEYILLRAYGAAFVNQEPEITLPDQLVFADENETKAFQDTLIMGKVDNTNNCYLQKAAADALNRARAEANIPLRSGYGASDCTRSFETNLRFWKKYASKQTLARVQQGKETRILGIVAPPGTSQHLWGLAVDLGVSNEAQKQVLNQHGWFRTVENDTPHWTYLGQPPEKLSELGFQNKIVRGIMYWITPL